MNSLNLQEFLEDGLIWNCILKNNCECVILNFYFLNMYFNFYSENNAPPRSYISFSRYVKLFLANNVQNG